MDPTTQIPASTIGLRGPEGKSLPKYFLGADGLLNKPLPVLNKGKNILETIAQQPSITRHYTGELAHWNTFKDEAIKFYEDDITRKELARCAHAPINIDPAVEILNSKVMTHERLQCGAEISLSGRYFWNLLAVVLHIVETLASEEHGTSENPDFLPKALTFGDSWILEKHHRVEGQQPDVLLKLPIEGKGQIRLVGELKFCVNVDFQTMLHNGRGRGNKFRGILGQLVQYMIGHGLKYGFISNYEETIFLQLDLRNNGEPCIYYSDIIKDSDLIDNSNDKVSVSLRLALFYLTQKTSSPKGADWAISKELCKSMKNYIMGKTIGYKAEVTAYGSRSLVPTRTPQRSPLGPIVTRGIAPDEQMQSVSFKNAVKRDPGNTFKDLKSRLRSAANPKEQADP
ncbi:hypothetical protein TW65_00898 [Stemphylium lycopersici]|uniref:Uncharacterized protein n=1 Tax=Stemphylium lycopersici TaxID=183478 RepID=A0A364N2I5_STELY|nr:hypothetical protein TW65_00898 [Stemphylium lycopersici]RAR10249.1 hypothetical protein DDE83_005114 [Stemphylium lycopersici]